MATNIDISNITNTTDVTESVANGTGIFDKLMNTVNLYLNDQYLQGRLKGTDYANVLTGSIQAVLQQSMQFTLQEQLTEAQVDAVRKDIDLKDSQIIGSGYDNQVKEQQVLESAYRVEELLPKELEKITQEITTMVEQEKLVYTERVVKDKQCADLGLDNVYGKVSAAKSSNADYVYTPFYEEL